ncbi:MAG: hypothetical protein O3A82_02145 [Verrucomicrobia bacterium]|nr:hypothetical protein [Verrucomicrobiota bacterium]MDA1045710.1 hypothetical protein [Verrucomicrobiota bacterium]
MRRFLEERLKLKVNEEKSKVVKAADLEFLGFVFKGGKIVWSEKSLRTFQAKIRELTRRSCVRFHGVETYEARAIHARVDGLLCD